MAQVGEIGQGRTYHGRQDFAESVMIPREINIDDGPIIVMGTTR